LWGMFSRTTMGCCTPKIDYTAFAGFRCFWGRVLFL
jgi:hypothetical protein